MMFCGACRVDTIYIFSGFGVGSLIVEGISQFSPELLCCVEVLGNVMIRKGGFLTSRLC